MPQRLIKCCLLLVLLAVPAFAGDEAPPWLQQAATTKAPTYKKDVPAVVLLDEQQVTVGEDGRITTVRTYAIRILTREGRHFAVAHGYYETDNGKVREIRAWLIRPSGVVKRFDKDDVLDQAAAMNDVYNESRIKAILASEEAEVGAVFGYQTVIESRSFFSQDIWKFQNRLPTLSSRYTLTLPAGWSAQSVTFNHAKVEPTINGSTYTWALGNLPPIDPEPQSPAVTTLAPRVAVSYMATSAQTAHAKNFDKWADVSRWYTELSEPQVTLDDAVAAKARDLTSNAKTELERIRAIAQYVQGLQYISIQIGVGRYRPHTATEVFAKSYGDCKDKATLMRAMLKAVKIPSYMVLIHSGDPTFVREEWPSPSQFNHAIIAVKVNDETKSPTIVEHSTLGRLLIFDATDPHTQVGDLPDHEQGSFALVAAGEGGALMRMPVTPPEANHLEREVELTLGEDGSLKGVVRERSVGQAAVSERRYFRALSRSDYDKVIEGWITRGATGSKITKIAPVDSVSDGRFALDVEFSAPRYGQLMQNRLLIFKPAVVSRRESLTLTEPTRKHPVVLDASAYTETVRVKLPEGFQVDELPDALKLDTSFGSYAATYEVKEGQLLFTRKLVTRPVTIPAEQYAAVRGFFERMLATEQAPVVLARE
jgi:hypothetical protein